MNQKKILIADDSELNRAILIDTLEKDFEVMEVSNGKEAIAALRAYREEIAVLLLDVVMPEADGFEVLDYMNEHGWIEELPVIMISAETGSTYIDRAFKLGASDYVSRPFVPGVIRRRIMNTVLLHTKKQQLMSIAADRFYRKEKNNELLVSILSHAVEFRSGEGGTHMSHVGTVTGLLLRRLVDKTDRYHLESVDLEAIQMAAGLHDIGKLLIPEDILNKPTELTPEEFEIVKHHTQLGAKLITELPIYQNERLIKYALEVCRWHHERWNGEGYPDGLKGDEIPIAAQAVSVADVYDALVSKRSYKEAYSHEKTMQMIHGGQCGSFDPLLLECLDEIADTLKRDLATPPSADQGHRVVRSVVEDLYRGQDASSARVALRLEEEHAKRHFFSDLTDELWFEYTTHPVAMVLSNGACKATGLPSMVVDPFANPDLIAVVGRKTLEKIRDWVRKATADDTYLEMEVQLLLHGELRWCQLAVMLTWSAEESGECSSLVGRVRDINRNYCNLQEYKNVAAGMSNHEKLTPLLAEKDGVLRITKEQVAGVLSGYQQIFDLVRLVDPEVCMQLEQGNAGWKIDKSERCYAAWERMRRCDRCISQEAVRTHKTQTKIETIGSEIYYVIAAYVEVDGAPYALEMINRIRSEDMLGEGDKENVINQLLVRNRQVYMDSVTKVYNRRYYDERLCKLDGEFAFAMLDMDNFKHINDRYGHLAGDAALYRAAQAIKSEIRSNDELVRYGGDEFFLLFHDMPHDMLERKLQAVREAVDGVAFPEYPGLRISVSIGGAYVTGVIEETVHKADIALYEAKTKRDCVAIYREEEK